MADKKLRFITYLSPDIPVKVFEMVMSYLEEVVGCNTYLIYESRRTGPEADQKDPFTLDEVDVGFMESTDFLRLVDSGHKFVTLCEAGPVHIHTKNSLRPVYYTDLIITADNKTKYKEIHDLRGHTVGYNSPTSITCGALLENLKKNGYDASFFRESYETGSHLGSIEAVLSTRADVAAVSSVALDGYLRSNPQKDQLHVLASYGPLPTYPLVLNTRLSDELKQKITKALLEMDRDPKWGQELRGLNIAGFVPCDMSLYSLERDIQASVQKMNIKSTYY